MIKQKTIFIIFLTFTSMVVYGQKTRNQKNNEGKRHGYWSKNYQGTNQKRYEGNFDNGKEVGLFKFFKLNKGKSVLSATKLFSKESEIIEVKFYSSKGKIVSEGQMIGKNYTGKWLYYHKNSDAIMSVEHYNGKGQLDGVKLTYYDNGNLAENVHFVDGRKEGLSETYSKNEITLKSVNFRNDELNGMAKYFNGFGQITSEGNYLNNRKVGVWRFYKQGQLTKEIDYSKATNPPFLRERQ